RFNEQVAPEKISAFGNEFLSAIENQQAGTAAEAGPANKRMGSPVRRMGDSTLLMEGRNILKDIYDKGVVLANNENLPADGIINVLKRNVSEEHSLNDYFTIHTA